MTQNLAVRKRRKTMTKKELVEELNKYPDDAIVFLDSSDWDIEINKVDSFNLGKVIVLYGTICED